MISFFERFIFFILEAIAKARSAEVRVEVGHSMTYSWSTTPSPIPNLSQHAGARVLIHIFTLFSLSSSSSRLLEVHRDRRL